MTSYLVTGNLLFRIGRFFSTALYNCSMAATKKKAAKAAAITYGQYLAQLRQAAGLSQRALARQLGVPQSNITFWEHGDKPPRSELLPKLADLLGVSVEQLLRPVSPQHLQRKGGPAGKARLVFERVSKLPRHQQDKILAVVEVFLNQFEPLDQRNND